MEVACEAAAHKEGRRTGVSCVSSKTVWKGQRSFAKRKHRFNRRRESCYQISIKTEWECLGSVQSTGKNSPRSAPLGVHSMPKMRWQDRGDSGNGCWYRRGLHHSISFNFHLHFPGSLELNIANQKQYFNLLFVFKLLFLKIFISIHFFFPSFCLSSWLFFFLFFLLLFIPFSFYQYF